jgi:hypothetical protein
VRARTVPDTFNTAPRLLSSNETHSGRELNMNRVLLLLPVLALIGCDQAASTSTTSKPVAAASAEPQPAPTPKQSHDYLPSVPSATTDPAPRPETQDPPLRGPEVEEQKEPPPEQAPPIPDNYKPLNKNKTIYFEVAPDGTRRVHLMTEVCLREGALEVFMCKFNTKEHESILRVDADARDIHLALLAANAKPGHPAQYIDPKTGKADFKPPTGTSVKVTVTYREKGQLKTVKAGTWVKDANTKKNLDVDWVFSGSRFFKDPEGKSPDYYLANNGEVITVSNFPESMLDVPIKSSKDRSDRPFVADTPKIPPLKTPVLVTLEPVVEKKK